MNNTSNTQPSPTKPISRDQVLTLLKTALSVGERKYARRTALAWLAFYPGDLEIGLLHARALLQEENSLSLKQALHILEDLCATDPEFLDARMELTQAKLLSGLTKVADSIGYEIGLGRSPEYHQSGNVKKIPKWAQDLHEARKCLSKESTANEKSITNAEQTIHNVITQDFNNPLIAVTHIKILSLNNSLSGLGMLSLAEAYHNRWPKCIQFILYLADSYMAIGESDQAVSLLHKAVSADITGQVAKRQWGENHPYRALWPQHIEINNTGINTPQNISIPASVAVAMGWNQLPENTLISESGKYFDFEQVTDPQISSESFTIPRKNTEAPTSAAQATETLHSDPIQEAWRDFHTLTSKLKQHNLTKMDGRFPIYVVFTTKLGLESMYGKDIARAILDELKNLVKTMRGSRINHRKWGSILYCPDDTDNVSSFGLKPVPHNDPWGLKLSLSDLDNTLRLRGEMIGAVLIIGGPEVVPFHYLPNPVDDDDPDVPSDNPYATRDENYFVQEWPIGRLPGSADKDASILLRSIQAIKERYITRKHSNPWYRRVWNLLIDAIWPPFRKIQPSLGYSAAVWQRASLSVYRTIGQPRSLLISPPVKSCDPYQGDEQKDELGNSICITLNPSMLAYFNLHGLQDSAEWYGQSDPVDIRDYPDFPIALRPQDITNGGKAPKVVFSEACYGAHIIGKRSEEAIALKFLASGSQCVIGSSCISYGSIRTPLIGADLLGHAFWKYLTDGMTVGEALRWAKIHLIKEMNKRQGFLDGEDQKTLISFVLYGDPLSQPYESNRTSKLSPRITNSHGNIKTVCARIDHTTEPSPVPDEIMTNVKHVVSHYLPGMKDANVSIGTERTGCQNACRNCLSGNLCPTAQLTPKKVGNLYSDRRVITLSKSIQKGKTDHKQFAHITLAANGKVLKLAVSR